MYFRTKTSGGRQYLQLVTSKRETGRVRQQVVATLGRLDALTASGQLERLVRSGARFLEQAMVLSAATSAAVPEVRSLRIGAALVFERLWAESGCQAVLAAMAGRRQFGFDVERAVFVSVLHRLLGGGSDRDATRWWQDYRIAGADALALHQLYRTMGWLGESLDGPGAAPATGTSAPRWRKDLIEEQLFERRRDLFSDLDLVFLDTTSLYFEGRGGESLGAYGFSKDHRSDCKQVILAVLLDRDGRPICSELKPGNTHDTTLIVPLVQRLKRRFAIGRVCIVADRGMISAANIKEIETSGCDYVLGARERSDPLVRDVVLADATPFTPHRHPRRRGDVEYGVKEVRRDGKRYIVCYNPEQAAKDKADRDAILAKLAAQLKKGAKTLIANTGYRRFLSGAGPAAAAIDPAKVEAQARFDGRFVLHTNLDLAPVQVMLRYKDLWMVEDSFRTTKELFATRPVFHQRDDAIRGHIFCSFLALVLKRELEARLDALDAEVSWREVIADLDSLTETEIVYDDKRFTVRAAPRPAATQALRAAGVALPPTVRRLAAP